MGSEGVDMGEQEVYRGGDRGQGMGGNVGRSN